MTTTGSHSLTINYLHNGRVQMTDIRDHGHAHRAIAATLSRMGMDIPAALDSLTAGHTLDLGGGLAVQLVATDSIALIQGHDGTEGRCDQCGTTTHGRRCTACDIDG